MIVRFYATLRPVVGGKAVELPGAPGLTVRRLLEELVALYPDLDRQLFEPDGQLYRHVHVFVNGRDAPYLPAGLETTLRGDEKLDIFPPVGGGAAAFATTVTAIPIWLLASYLEELGARPADGAELRGDGWAARLTQVEDHRVGSLRVGRVLVEISGTDEALARVRPALEKRLVRGGG